MHFPARHIVRDDVVDPRFITNSDSPYKIAQKHSHKHGTELTFTADHIVSHIEMSINHRDNSSSILNSDANRSSGDKDDTKHHEKVLGKDPFCIRPPKTVSGIDLVKETDVAKMGTMRRHRAGTGVPIINSLLADKSY